jgi:predicted  nucleic acid-binding Zn-ribbon protein
VARTSKHPPEALLDLARAAVAENPDVPVATFRRDHGVGTTEAHAVLTAARWERGYRHYGRLPLEQIHPRYQSLVKAPETHDPSAAIRVDAAPEVLRLEVDRAFEAVRDAVGRVGEHLRAAAQRAITDAQASAAGDIVAAEGAARDLASEVEVAQRHEADARRESATLREQLNAEISRLTQELRDQTRERAAAERARELAEADRRQALAAMNGGREATQKLIGDLTSRLGDAQRAAGATERHVQTMTEVIADMRRRLDDAVGAAAKARQESSASEARASAAEARVALLQQSHAAELLRMREV